MEDLTSISRLQFRHNDTVFSSNTEAIRQFIVHGDDEDMRLKSLKGEPTVLFYGHEGNPHVILAIGAKDNISSFGSSNRYCFIDIHDIKKHIFAHYKEFKETVGKLSAVALTSDTLDFYAEETANGTLMSGDVKTAYSHTDHTSGKVYYNQLINLKTDDPDQKGLFMYVNLDWDERENKFVFKVSKPDGTIESTDFPIPNKYIESGYYDIKEEKIVLRYNDDSEPIKIDCKYLISEWVADEGETTPIILKKEIVKFKDDDIHRLEPWQDILHADVRIKDELFDENGNAYKVDGSTNILERTYEGRALYVDGSASNIIYYKDGENITVQGALDELINTKPSSDSRNIIVKKPDGFYADVRLRYDKGKNKLTLIVSSLDDQGNITTKETPIELAVANFLDQVWYDSATEEIVIAYTDGTGTKQYTRIPVSDLIEEWAVYNEYHSVKLVKVRNSGSGPDLLSADVKITKTARNNILEDRNHELYVRGEANNIKYDATSDTTVKDVLGNLSANTTFLSGAIDSVSAIVDTNIERIDNEIETISANALSKIIDITSENKSLTVVNSGDTDPTVDLKVNIYPESGNTIAHIMTENASGLFNYVDLTYDSHENRLTFKKSNVNGGVDTSVLQLESIQTIESITYDAATEELVIRYKSGDEIKELRVPLRTLIDEWDVYNDVRSAVKLKKEWDSALTKNILSAEVIVSDKSDNILVNDEGALYASNSGITALEDRMDDAEDRLDNAETNINTISGDLQTEINERESEINRIDITIGSGFSTDTHETITYRFEQVTNDLQSEVDRATSEEQRIEEKIDHEVERSMSADSVHDSAITTINNTIGTGFTSSADSNITFKFETLSGKLDTEIQRSTDEDARILGLIDRERARAESAETALDDKIDNITLTFEDTPSIDFNNPYNEGNIVKANLKLDTNPRGNILYIDSAGGVGANVALSYDSGRNELKFEKTNSSGDTDVNLITLNAGSIINSITYDDVTKELIILYEDAAGVEHETRVDVSSLFNEWTPVTDHLGAVLLTKTQHTGTHGADELRAEAVISTLPTNILINDQGSLYVDGSPISAATELGECVKAELKTIEKVLIGETIQDCSTSYTYHNHSTAHYIHSATSFDDADVILDQIAYNLDMAIQDLANPEDTATVHMYNDNGKLKSDVIQSTQHGTTTSTTYGVNMVELLNDGVYVNGTIDCGEFDGNVEPIDYSNHGRNVNA